MIGWKGLLLEYAQWFDLDGVDEVITLQEGHTPLIHADRLSDCLLYTSVVSNLNRRDGPRSEFGPRARYPIEMEVP